MNQNIKSFSFGTNCNFISGFYCTEISFADLSVGLLPGPEALPPQSHPDGVQPGACHETAFRTVVPRRLHDEDVRPPRFHRDQVPGGDRDLGLGECAEVVHAPRAFSVLLSRP